MSEAIDVDWEVRAMQAIAIGRARADQLRGSRETLTNRIKPAMQAALEGRSNPRMLRQLHRMLRSLRALRDELERLGQ